MKRVVIASLVCVVGALACSSSSSSGSSGSSGSSSGTSGTSGTSGSSGSSSGASGTSGTSGSSSGTSGASSGASGSSGNPGQADSGPRDASGDSLEAAHCGQPGDMGNALGVGKYCVAVTDCLGNSGATICSTIGDANSNFCTMACTQGNTTQCGDAASCQCQNGQCGCLPDVCL